MEEKENVMFKLSQSKLVDFETMCPIEFKAKHIVKDGYPEFVPTIAMEWGNYFETKCIGSGVRGAFSFDESLYGAKMQRSVDYERVLAQVEAYKRFRAISNFKMTGRQVYISATIIVEGVEIEIEGTLDIECIFPEYGIGGIDLKLTGSTENGFGKFAWATPEKMDLVQIKHYALLLMLKHNLETIPNMEYWVFDTKEGQNKKLIRCNISEYALEMHKQRLLQAWNEIQFSIAMDDWTPNNTYENCSKCKSPCRFKRVMPEYHLIEL